MTRNEAMAALVDAYPDKSICIEVKSWTHWYGDRRGYDSPAYCIALVPGTDGTPCTRFEAKNIAAAVGAALVAAAPPELPEIVEQHFAEGN
jgi:hypothetical protein